MQGSFQALTTATVFSWRLSFTKLPTVISHAISLSVLNFLTSFNTRIKYNQSKKKIFSKIKFQNSIED